MQREEHIDKEALLHNIHQRQQKPKADVEQQNDNGVRFVFCAYTTCPFRPVGPSRVDPKTLVADFRAIRDWEFLMGKKWSPYAVSGEYLNFLIDPKQDRPLKNNDQICKAGQVVSVSVNKQYKLKEEWSKTQVITKNKKALAHQE